ncbi:MAG TPA: T9SS type A sorting domain-containing protein, partial [Flavisolibacter sp.]
VFTCEVDAIASPIITCTICGGDGKTGTWNFDPCTACEGVGMVHETCKHPFGEVSGNSVLGPVENFLNIDTLATQVMATYQYINTDKITFRYGAKSGAKASNGSGMRLNSTWFRQFSLAPPMTLPVKITSFTAGWNNEAAHIAWTTENEQNFSHFVVERSTDGKTFEAVATVFSMELGAYSFKDTKASSASGVLYYRLRSVDKTKESSLSQVRVIRFGKEQGAITLAVSPNPAIDAVRVSLPDAWQNKAVTLEVYTPAGIRLQSTNISHVSGAATVYIGKYSNGMYLIKASCEGQTAQQRIVKN